MYWGSGTALGLLTLFGYVFFVAGAALIWRQREHFSIWFQDEFSVFRRNFSRYTTIGPFYGIRREESRLKAFSTSFVRTLRRLPRSRVKRGAILLFAGLLLFLLDLLI
jgi:hypothetical protein